MNILYSVQKIDQIYKIGNRGFSTIWLSYYSIIFLFFDSYTPGSVKIQSTVTQPRNEKNVQYLNMPQTRECSTNNEQEHHDIPGHLVIFLYIPLFLMRKVEKKLITFILKYYYVYKYKAEESIRVII